VIVKQIWTANNYRNFNYLIACRETGEALAIDPLDHEKCLKAAKDEGWEITQILNTHEHRDHTGGNEAVAGKTGAAILAHKNARSGHFFQDFRHWLGDIIAPGRIDDVHPGKWMARQDDDAGSRSIAPGVLVMSRVGPCFTGTVKISPWASITARKPVGDTAAFSSCSPTLSIRERTSGMSASISIGTSLLVPAFVS